MSIEKWSFPTFGQIHQGGKKAKISYIRNKSEAKTTDKIDTFRRIKCGYIIQGNINTIV